MSRREYSEQIASLVKGTDARSFLQAGINGLMKARPNRYVLAPRIPWHNAYRVTRQRYCQGGLSRQEESLASCYMHIVCFGGFITLLSRRDQVSGLGEGDTVVSVAFSKKEV
jgi:hypothetical protein